MIVSILLDYDYVDYTAQMAVFYLMQTRRKR